MSKDPAFLFYDGDAARDVSHMNRLERGAYFDLIQSQRKFGGYTVEQARKILGKDFDEVWPALELILTKDENGKFYIEWIQDSIEERKVFAEKQRKKIQDYWDNKKKEEEEKEIKKQQKRNKSKDEPRNNHGITVDIPLEEEDEDENEDEEEDEEVEENKRKEGVGEKQKSNLELKNDFDDFRVKYPGNKRGLDPEFENFVRRNSKWRDLIPILSVKLDYQIKARQEKAQKGGFIPEWKNLQTWINQKCWTEEITITNTGTNSRETKSILTYDEILKLSERNPDIWKSYRSEKREGERKAVFVPIEQ
jgi:hypothetical protein